MYDSQTALRYKTGKSIYLVCLKLICTWFVGIWTLQFFKGHHLTVSRQHWNWTHTKQWWDDCFSMISFHKWLAPEGAVVLLVFTAWCTASNKSQQKQGTVIILIPSFCHLSTRSHLQLKRPSFWMQTLWLNERLSQYLAFCHFGMYISSRFPVKQYLNNWLHSKFLLASSIIINLPTAFWGLLGSQKDVSVNFVKTIIVMYYHENDKTAPQGSRFSSTFFLSVGSKRTPGCGSRVKLCRKTIRPLSIIQDLGIFDSSNFPDSFSWFYRFPIFRFYRSILPIL